jgi:hypothetical protein
MTRRVTLCIVAVRDGNGNFDDAVCGEMSDTIILNLSGVNQFESDASHASAWAKQNGLVYHVEEREIEYSFPESTDDTP